VRPECIRCWLRGVSPLAAAGIRRVGGADFSAACSTSSTDLAGADFFSADLKLCRIQRAPNLLQSAALEPDLYGADLRQTNLAQGGPAGCDLRELPAQRCSSEPGRLDGALLQGWGPRGTPTQNKPFSADEPH